MLVIVKHRNVHDLLELVFNHKAVGPFDIFQIDAAEAGAEQFHSVYELLRICCRNFEIDSVDVSEFLHENTFSLHDRFPSERPNVAKTEDSCSVTYDAD